MSSILFEMAGRNSVTSVTMDGKLSLYRRSGARSGGIVRITYDKECENDAYIVAANNGKNTTIYAACYDCCMKMVPVKSGNGFWHNKDNQTLSFHVGECLVSDYDLRPTAYYDEFETLIDREVANRLDRALERLERMRQQKTEGDDE